MSTNTLRIDQWDIDLGSGEITNNQQPEDTGGKRARIDPIGIRLLLVLMEHKGELVHKQTLMSRLWPDAVVNEDALSRCISRVRKALADNPKQPRFIETLPKRGYRLKAISAQWLAQTDDTPTSADPRLQPMPERMSESVSETISEPTSEPISPGRSGAFYATVLLMAAGGFALASYWLFGSISNSDSQSSVAELLEQGDYYYFQINRGPNEMALEFYQRAVTMDRSSALAHAGMANALVQRAMRLPSGTDTGDWQSRGLQQALKDGRFSDQSVRSGLEKALMHGQKAVALGPDNPRTHKALGLALSAVGRLDQAMESYQQGISIDPLAWDALVNLGDIHEIRGQLATAIQFYKRAFDAMKHSGPISNDSRKAWRVALGASIGDKYQLLSNANEAEIWYRRALGLAPFDAKATKGLTAILIAKGQSGEAQRLCDAYAERVGETLCARAVVPKP